jgi:hypothetical protein
MNTNRDIQPNPHLTGQCKESDAPVVGSSCGCPSPALSLGLLLTLAAILILIPFCMKYQEWLRMAPARRFAEEQRKLKEGQHEGYRGE